MVRWMVLVMLVIGGRAPAQGVGDPKPEPTKPVPQGFFAGHYESAAGPRWRVQVEPVVWYVSPGGDVALGGGPITPTLELNIDSPNIGGGGEVHLHADPYRISLLGFAMSQRGSSTAIRTVTYNDLAITPGDRIETDFDLAVAEVRLGWRVWDREVDPLPDGSAMLSSGLELVAGLRAYDYDLMLARTSGTPGSTRGDILQVEPVIGFKWDISFADMFDLDLAANFGGMPKMSGQSSSSLDITVGTRFRPQPNIGVQLGYRLLIVSLESDDAELQGALAGIYSGVVVRF
ncbi:MAG TPA: hypothetical protein ENJ00_04195 [Phycisphaerales bacterium]|nr:hypothetical protein [Phycisphaerales bacterium]